MSEGEDIVMRYKLRYSLFFFAMTLFIFASNFIHPVTPTLIQNLNLPDYMFGLMPAATLLFMFLFSPFWGKITTMISSRNTLLITSIGYAVAQATLAYCTQPVTMLAMRSLAGFFGSGSFVAFLTYVINTAKSEDQAKFLTYSATIQAVAAPFGYLAGGVLGEWSLIGTFYIHASAVVVSGFIFRFACEADFTHASKLPLRDIIKDSNPLQAIMDGRHFMTKAFALLFTVNVLMNFGNFGFDHAFNYYLKDQLHLTSSYNGIIKAAVGFVSFLANMTLCMWMLHKTNVKKSMISITLFCTLAAAGVLLIPNMAVYIACSIMVYAGYSISLPLVQHMSAEESDPAQKNLVMGFYNATKWMGSVIGSLTAGLLYSIHAQLPFAVAAAAYGVSILAAIGYLLSGKKSLKTAV